MKNIRTLTPIFGLLATAVYAFAQTPPAPPRPAAAPRPMAAPTPLAVPEPMPAMAPLAPLEPMTPMPAMAPMAYIGDLDLQEAKAMAREQAEAAREQFERMKIDMRFDHDRVEAARDQVERMKLDMRHEIDADVQMQVQAQQWAIQDMAMMNSRNLFAFAPQVKPVPPTPPAPPAAPFKLINMRMSDDRLYSSGQSALDNRQWEQAVE
jgi:hypothetical protein